MKNPRSLVEAVGSWLFFEDKCRRDSLFCEKYLTFPVGQLLKARYGEAVRSEYEHPILSASHSGPGDKPRVDFVVLNQNGDIDIAIETKWLRSGMYLLPGVLRDLVRLELLANEGASTAFLMAGKQRSFNSLYNSHPFQGHPEHPQSRPIIPFDHNGTRVLRLHPAPAYRRSLFERTLEPFEGRKIATAFKLTRTLPFPRGIPSYQFVVYGWRISSFGEKRETFDPIQAKT